MTPEQANTLAGKMLVEELSLDAIYTRQIQSIDSFINFLSQNNSDDSEPLQEPEEG